MGTLMIGLAVGIGLGVHGVAQAAGPDAYEPDDRASAARGIANRQTQNRSIHVAGNKDWIKFKLTSSRKVVLTTGPRRGYRGGDTQMWLYGPNNSLRLVTGGYNDNYGGTQWSRIAINSLRAGTYYVQVREKGNNARIPGYTLKAVFSSVPSVAPGMVLIPGGTNAGSDPDFGAYSRTVTSFYMDKYEVRKALWDEVYNWAIANGYGFDNAGSSKATNHPVNTVNWYDCVKWCNARSQKEGRTPVYTVNSAVYKTGQADNVVRTSAGGYRLPSDEEWEYAARGGVASHRFPWGASDEIQHVRANYYSSSSYSYDTSPTRNYHPAYNAGRLPYTSPVGSFAANGYGLHDMAGNVIEWNFDWYPGNEGSARTFRGGGWNSYAANCQVGSLSSSEPGYAFDSVGFRTVRAQGQ